MTTHALPATINPCQVSALLRTGGLLRVGARSARITPSGFEQYYDLGHSIAKYVTSPQNRDVTLACKPADVKAPDDACATQFFTKVGRLLYRRGVPVGADHFGAVRRERHSRLPADAASGTDDDGAPAVEPEETVVLHRDHLGRVL